MLATLVDAVKKSTGLLLARLQQKSSSLACSNWQKLVSLIVFSVTFAVSPRAIAAATPADDEDAAACFEIIVDVQTSDSTCTHAKLCGKGSNQYYAVRRCKDCGVLVSRVRRG